MTGKIKQWYEDPANVPTPPAGQNTWFFDSTDGGDPKIRKPDGLLYNFADVVMSGAAPADVGTAAPGVSSDASRSDHVHAHGNQLGGTLHANASGLAAGFMSAADFTLLAAIATDYVPETRTLTAGAGLTGGGDLQADRTFNVGANADGSMVVNANDIQVGVLATDAQHGVRGGGTQHAAASGVTNGFMSSVDKTKLDTYPATPPSVIAGAGMTGGGALTGNVTLDVVANADGSITVAADSVGVGILATDAQHGNRGGGGIHANVVAGGAAGFMTGTDKTKLDTMASGAAVASVVATAPITSTGGTTPNIGITAATDTAQGAIELATQAEVDTGTDAVRAVTPLTLRGLSATILTALINLATALLNGLMSAADFVRVRKEWDAYGDFGLVGDLRTAFEITSAGTQVVITSGLTTVTIPNAGATTPFTSTAVDAGKRITIAGAGAGGAVYVGTIVSVTNSTTCVVTPAASTTVTATTTQPIAVQWGTDNTSAAATMVTTLNAQTYPCPKITFGGRRDTDWTNAWGFPASMVFNKAVWLEGIGGGHTCDTGDYTKIGGTRLAWWGTSSDGGTAFQAFITISPTGVQSLKRPCVAALWIDCRNGDQNQALYGLKLASCHGAMLDDGFFVMDALAQGLWTDIATSPTEAKDCTRFDFGRLCFRQLDNAFGATLTTTTTTFTSALTASGQTMTLASITGYSSGGGYAWVMTRTGQIFLIRYTGTSGSTITGCTVSAEDVVQVPTPVSGSFVVPCQPGLGGAMKLSGGSGANTCCGTVRSVQVSFGSTWGQAAIDCGNADSLVFWHVMMNGGDNTTESAINRKRRPGVRLNGSHTSNTLASRNNVFRDIDPGGSPSGPLGGISAMGVLDTGALLLAPSGPNYVEMQQMGNGSPLPTVEFGAFLKWSGNGMFWEGAIGPGSVTTPAALTAAAANLVTGTLVVVPPQGWQLGTRIQWRIPMVKTLAGAANRTVAVKYGSVGTVAGDTVTIATAAYVTTAIADQGLLVIDLVCTALGTGTSAACLCQYEFGHNLPTTGLSTGVTVPAGPSAGTSGKVFTTPTMAGFNSDLPKSGPAFLHIDITPGASEVLTIPAPVSVICLKAANP